MGGLRVRRPRWDFGFRRQHQARLAWREGRSPGMGQAARIPRAVTRRLTAGSNPEQARGIHGSG